MPRASTLGDWHGPAPRAPTTLFVPPAARTPTRSTTLVRLSSGAQRVLLQRVACLALAFGVLCGSASVLAAFEAVLARDVAYAFFLPLVVGHAGNCGGQTVATVVRVLCHRAVPDDDLREDRATAAFGVRTSAVLVVLAEAGASSLATVALTAVFLPVALGTQIAAANVLLATTLALNLLAPFASLVGATVCYLTCALHLDPATWAAPTVTTFSDLAGVAVYFAVASAL
jgi:magnesium transporter